MLAFIVKAIADYSLYNALMIFAYISILTLIFTDLLYWHLLYLDETFTSYNHFVNAITWKGNVIAVTGKSLLIFDSKDVKEAFEKKPFLVPYRAHFEMLKELIYTSKRILWIWRL